MPLSLQDLRNYLGTRKLKFELHEGGRHQQFHVRLQNRDLGLPTVLCVSRGDGEADHRNVKGVATALGMRETELLRSEGCHIGRGCVLLMLCSRLLAFICQRAMQLGGSAVAKDGLKAMAESIGLLLQEPEIQGGKPWNSDEQKALDRIKAQIEEAGRDPALAPVARQVLAAIRARQHG